MTLVRAADRPDQLAVNLRNRGGGIGRVVIKLNGKEISADARGPRADPNAGEMQLPLDVPADHPLVAPGKRNVVEVFAYNSEGYLSSRGLEYDFDAPDVPEANRPDVWLIAAGISDYRGDSLDLRYAAKDAENVAESLHLAAERLFGAGRGAGTGPDFKRR